MILRFILTAVVLVLGVGAYFGLGFYNDYTLHNRLTKTVEDVTQLTETWVGHQYRRALALAQDDRLITPLEGDGFIDLNALRRALYEFGYLEKIDNLFVYSDRLDDKVIYPATTTAITPLLLDVMAQHLRTHITPLLRLVSTPMGPMFLVAAPIMRPGEDPLGMAGFALSLDRGLVTHQRPVIQNLPDSETFLLDTATPNGPLVILDAFNNKKPKTHTWAEKDIPNLKQHVLQFFDLDQPRLIAGSPVTDAPGWWTLLTLSQSAAATHIRFYQLLALGIMLGLLLLFWLPLLLTAVQSLAVRAGEKKSGSGGVSGGNSGKSNKAYLDYRTAAERKAAALGRKSNAPSTTPVQKVKSPERKLADVIEQSLKEKRTRLLFQPVFDVYTREAVMCEVFLRIEDDNGDIITPDKFIPVAQRYKLLPKIDAHVVTRVIEEYLAPHNTNVPLAVNLGGGTFESIAFLQTMMDRIQPEWSPNLILELRSQEIIRDAKAMDFVHNCRKLGCRFSIDYFGGGAAMLSGTKRMQFNFLKLDSLSFQSAEAKKELIRLARAAQEIDLSLILERVESEEDIILAQKVGIPFVQGYFLAIPGEKLEY